jgi:hypothetical protein
VNAIIWLAVLGSMLETPVQSWSPAQQEIIDHTRRCNDAWVASHAEKRFEVFESVCPAADQAVFWYTDGDTPVTYKGQDGMWAGSVKNNRSITWQDLRPVVVNVDANVAFIYYAVTWTPQPVTGSAAPRRSRRLTVFQRQNGRWVMSGGTIASVRD